MTDPRAWLDQVDARAKEDAPPPYKVADDALIATTALRAVLDLHSPRPYSVIRDGVTFEQTDYPDLCAECRQTYPCPTVTAITTALEGSAP